MALRLGNIKLFRKEATFTVEGIALIECNVQAGNLNLPVNILKTVHAMITQNHSPNCDEECVQNRNLLEIAVVLRNNPHSCSSLAPMQPIKIQQ